MKDIYKGILIGAVCLSLGFAGGRNTASNAACVPGDFKIAVVDINNVVNQSKDIQLLKQEQQNKVQELQKWLTAAKNKIDNQKTQAAKDKLIKQYEEEFTQKQQKINEEYTAKLKKIDTHILNIISERAYAKHYDLVVAKGAVLLGGEDITAGILRAVK